MDIKILKPLGAEISGLDLNILSEDDSLKIRQCFLDNSVLIFRNQKLNPSQLKNISSLWGKPLVHPVFKGIEGYPEIIEIRNYGEQYHTNAHWHSDVTFEESKSTFHLSVVELYWIISDSDATKFPQALGPRLVTPTGVPTAGDTSGDGVINTPPAAVNFVKSAV